METQLRNDPDPESGTAPTGNVSAAPLNENPVATVASSAAPDEATASSAQKNKFKRRAVIVGGAVFIIAAAAGVFLWHNSRPAITKPVALTHISVRLEWLNNPEFAGMYVAKDMGYYKAAGLDVDLREFQDSTDVNKEVASGQVDFGVSSPLEVILARDKGENNKAIAAIYQTSAYSFVTRKSAHIETPADFKGKILGNVGDNNEAKVTYQVLMANAGLKPSDATIKPIDFDVVKDFQTNAADTADVYRTDQTYLLDQAHIAYDQLYPEQFGFAIYGDVLIASDAKIANNPKQTAAFVRATLKGWQYAVDHQPATLAILAKYDNASYKDPAYVKYDLAGTAPLIRPAGGQPFGSMSYVPWNRAYQGVETSGLLQKGFNVADVYTTQFVQAK